MTEYGGLLLCVNSPILLAQDPPLVAYCNAPPAFGKPREFISSATYLPGRYLDQAEITISFQLSPNQNPNLHMYTT